MKKLEIILSYSLILFVLTACNPLTNSSASAPTPGPAPGAETVLAIETATAEVPRPTPTSAPMGTIDNPLVVALPPGSSSDGARVEAGKAFAEQLSEITGYTFVVVAPNSYAKLVEAMGQGNAHVAVLSAYAYALAYREGYANAAFARVELGKKLTERNSSLVRMQASSPILMRSGTKILRMRPSLYPSSAIKSLVGPMKFPYPGMLFRPASWHKTASLCAKLPFYRDSQPWCGRYMWAVFAILVLPT